MAKSRSGEATKRGPKISPAADFTSPAGAQPNPPRRRPWFLLAASAAVAIWLLFLLWMAVDSSQ